MISLATILSALRTLIGIEKSAETVIETVRDAIDPEPRPESHPLTYKDIEFQRAQAARAARPGPGVLPPEARNPKPDPIPPPLPPRLPKPVDREIPTKPSIPRPKR